MRGALEAGVAFACGYPGTPSSEITDTFARLAPARGIGFEYSVNEKIAVEMAFAAALAGARSICAMKHLGLLVAGDPLSTIPYVGVEAGMVIVSAGDPGCRTSPNEQDQRHLGPMLHMPVLDPSTPQEALEFTRFAFELSEACRLPVLLRVTTRVCHSRSGVVFGPLSRREARGFVRDPARYVPIPHNARRMRLELTERIGTARETIEGNEALFRCRGDGAVAILSSGAPAATCADVLREKGIGDRVALWTLGAVHPLPEDALVRRLRTVERLLVVEELSPFLEDAVRALCVRHGLRPEILGKGSGHLPVEFEITPEHIEEALWRGLQIPRSAVAGLAPLPVPPRPPTLCPGCVHRAAFMAARSAFDDDQLFFNDIGCYSLGYGAPLHTADALLCMGAGLTLAAGVSKVTGQRTVGFVGDSTFFHAGMPALLNAVKENANVVLAILNNEVTAMTGFQESPASDPAHAPSIPAIVRALGAPHVETVDPYDLVATTAAFQRARDASGVSVVIVERACPTHLARTRQQPAREVVAIAGSHCRTCGRASDALVCSQPTTEGYQRQLVRGRGQRTDGHHGVAPVAACATACPLSLCIQGYAGNIAAGDYEEALRHVLVRTPLPESVCRTCHRPCEAVCVADQPIAINDLKRFVVEWAASQDTYPIQLEPEPPTGHSVAVVGAGPCGLAAAWDLALRGYAVTLFDRETEPGGLLAHGIPAYRLPSAALARDIERILALGVRFVGGQRLGTDIRLTGLLDDYDAVVVAVGASRPRLLSLEAGAGLPALVFGLEYLREVAATGRAETAERVVVIGGGNAAVDVARTARRLGAREVAMSFLEGRAAMLAITEEVDAAEAEGVALHPGNRTIRLSPGGLVVASIGGRDERVLPADQVIIAIGQEAALEDRAGLALSETGNVLAIDPLSGATSHPRVFAGGDVASTDRTVTGAIAAGLRVAFGVDQALRGDEVAKRRAPPLSAARARELAARVSTRPTGRTTRRDPPSVTVGARIGSGRDFVEVIGALAEEDARAEAARCLMCGQCGTCRSCIDLFGCPALFDRDEKAAIDVALCTGCGVCVDLCPNGAIHRGLP